MADLPAVSCKNIFFIASLIFLTFLFFHAVIVPLTTDYPFQTVTKFQGKYHNPIFLTFNWISHDELMVGKKILVSVEIRGLPYMSNQTLKDIQLKFNGLNYWTNLNYDQSNRISKTDTISFIPDWNNHVFRSNQIQIRYILPEDESAQLLDYNLPEPNMTINGIIHPAPHDTYVQIDTARTNAGVSLAVAVATLVIVWNSLKIGTPSIPSTLSTKQKLMMVLSFIAMGLLILFAYCIKWAGDNS